MIETPKRDPSLDTLLDLHDQTFVIDGEGHWVKFVVQQVPATAEKPHGLDDSLTLHAPDGSRLVGFDNAHQVKGTRRKEQDRKHRLRAIKPYDYNDPAPLAADFWAGVESVMRKKGTER